jgi:hypothetical protein
VFWRDLVSLLVLCTVAVMFVWTELKPDVVALKEHAAGWRRALYERIAGGFDGSPGQLAMVERAARFAPLLCVSTPTSSRSWRSTS